MRRDLHPYKMFEGLAEKFGPGRHATPLGQVNHGGEVEKIKFGAGHQAAFPFFSECGELASDQNVFQDLKMRPTSPTTFFEVKKKKKGQYTKAIFHLVEAL